MLENVSRETLDKLDLYKGLLLKWQKAINLVAPSTLNDVYNRHFRDSLQLLSYIPDESKTLIDFGSGAGFPGLVLAMSSSLDVTLVESDQRKCEFMKNVSRETFCPVTILNQRIEDVPKIPYDVITSRALASLDRLFSYSYPFLKTTTSLIFLKGEGVQGEIDEAQKDWSFESRLFPSQTGDGFVVLVTHLIRK